MNKEITVLQAKALYTINKEAKRNRDVRRVIRKALKVLKERLFSFDWKENYDAKLSEDEKEYLKSNGINTLDGPCTDYGYVLAGCKDVDEEEEEYWADVRKNINEIMDEEEEDSVDCSYDVESLRDLAKLLEMDELSLTAKEKIKILLEEAKRDLPFYDEARDMIDNMHALFGRSEIADLGKKMDNLYLLKGAIIKESGASPIRYDMDKNDGNYYLALYRIEGFTFHYPVLKSEVSDDMLSQDSKVISDISSENHLSAEDYIPVCDAVRILTEYLELPNDYADKIINGDEVDLVERFGLTPLSDFEYSAHSRECWDYEEYDDYDWNDYDWNDYE